ncbi:MAG: UDP-N-acetylmuramoyl-tripeptide--D-alanyl-D-alanine ligase [Clostridia bacterium]|nr:UDP-N-acetylmuramoyl-tripeptide--D-alanyl-D-alanine ligase [Clostridia bacterium]
MNIFITLCLGFLSLSAVFSIYNQYRMLQQNSYFIARYFVWLKTSYTTGLCAQAFLYCIISVLFLKDSCIIMSVLAFCVLVIRVISAVKCKKDAIKPLVFTGRVKRLYATAIVIFGILISIYEIFPRNNFGKSAVLLLFCLSCATPITVIIAKNINSPFERLVSRYYVNDAKRILKSHSGLKVIGITGSYGKTTTKFILNRILSEKYNTVCTPQSFNTPMGVVRTIREYLKPQTQIFICEMGAKKTGDIEEICNIVNPDFGIITSVGEQHLDTFGSVDNVFKTKFELYDAVTEKGGICLANIESAGIYERKSNCGKASFFGSGTKYFADNISYSSAGSTFTLHLDGEDVTVTTKLLGKHSVSDITAAAALAHILGVGAVDIKVAIAALSAAEHRLELKPFKNGSLLIDDAYNSNPEGCLEAVKVLGSFDGMKKTIITPGLIELGEREYDCNFALGLEAAKYCDIIILVGINRSVPLSDAIKTTGFNTDNLYVVSSFKEAMNTYLPMCDKDSVVLLENDLPDNYLN